MASAFNYLDPILFIALPYVALFVFALMSIRHYLYAPFTYSSLSTQMLENDRHFWSVVPFHIGILVLFFGHLAAFLTPRTILAWNSHPVRLYILEGAALIFGLLTLIGFVGIIARRITTPRVRPVTTRMDMAIYTLLLAEIVIGVVMAILYPWGSSWFAATLTPYLWSLFRFQPDLAYVTGLPVLVKLHIALAFVIFGLFPFTRLVHALVVPNPYLWRKPQVVRWYGRPRGIA